MRWTKSKEKRVSHRGHRELKEVSANKKKPLKNNRNRY